MPKIQNFEIDSKEKSVYVSVNPKIYPLEVIYSAAYMFLEKAYVIIDGDPESEIIVQMKAKGEEDLKRMALDFQNELVNYAVYVIQAARTSDIRKAIVEKALSVVEQADEKEECECEADKDPLGISKPWTPDSAKGLKIPEGLDDEDK
jgi:His-Xaa-Ser system protein HxsD